MRILRLPALLPPRSERPGVALALLVGLVGGLLALLAGLPLPWMLGPMILAAVAALARLPVAAPATLRPYVIPIIGVMLGSGFAPDLFAQVGSWVTTFLLLPPFLLVAGGAAWAFFRHAGGYDARTAFFCAAPGGLNEMALMGEEAGADTRRIALAHAVRIFIVVSAIAFGFALIDGTTAASAAAQGGATEPLSLLDAAALIACAIVGAPLAARLRLPAAGFFGPMILSAALHMSGIVAGAPPAGLVVLAQLVIGTILGCRFVGATLRDTRRDIALASGASLILIAVTLLFAGLVALLTTVPWSQAVLAYAPGGVTEMSLLALAKGQDVAYVATAHVVRIVLILAAIRPVFALMARHLPAQHDSSATGRRD